jgi:hypothetical protein
MRGQWAKCCSYLDNGYRVLLAEMEGQIVGHIWWHDHRLDRAQLHPQLLRYGLELKPGEVWSFDLWLLERYRGGGGSNDFFALFRQHLRQAGYARVWGSVDSAYLPAVWLHKIQGYRAVKTVEARLFFGAVLWSGGRLYLRNPPIGVRQKFDFRAVW